MARNNSEVCLIAVDEIHVPQKVWDKIMRRDSQQVDRMRQDFESGRQLVRVVLRRRFDGRYDVEDGRHRVIAAKMADEAYVEAIVVG